MEFHGGGNPVTPAPTQATAQMLFLETVTVVLHTVEVLYGELPISPSRILKRCAPRSRGLLTILTGTSMIF